MSLCNGDCAECDAFKERLYRSEALNAGLARMLKANEWHGGGSDKECPECGGVRGLGDHSPGCALAALLKKAMTE